MLLHMNKLLIILLFFLLYYIVHLTMINPYKMIPIECIIIYMINKINPQYNFMNEKEYKFNKRDKRDVLYNY